jgi:hypothetical protein
MARARIFLRLFNFRGLAITAVCGMACAGCSSRQQGFIDLRGSALLRAPGDYRLVTNITCPGTCFYVEGKGIRLNLNGHSITYGAGGGTSEPVYGIENNPCSTKPGPAAPCDRGKIGVSLEVFGGSIIQSEYAPPFSHALSFTTPHNSGSLSLHNLTIVIQQTGTQALHADGQGGSIRFRNNRIYDSVASINHPGQSDLLARSYFQGQAVWISGVTRVAYPDQIAYNIIVGAPQGGIRDTSDGAEIFGNDISQNATYSNDFCIDVPGDGQQIHDNYCHPLNGRGIHVNGENSRVYRNKVVVSEAKVNREYGKHGEVGCEFGGAFGIQVEDDNVAAVGGTVVIGNDVTLNTGQCGGGAFRITGWPGAAQAEVHGNAWRVNRTRGRDQFGGYIYFLEGADLRHVSFGGDSISTNDQACVGIDWDGVKRARIALVGCKASYAIDSENGDSGQEGDASGVSTFALSDAPNRKIKCGQEATSRGTINGFAVQCRARLYPQRTLQAIGRRNGAAKREAKSNVAQTLIAQRSR